MPNPTFRAPLMSLQLRCRLQEMLHLRVWILHVLGRVRSLSIPSPLLRQFGLQLALKHLCDVLAKHGKELEAVERTASCDVEPFGSRVRRNDKIRGGRESVPSECYISIVMFCRGTHQQIRCFVISQSALSGPYHKFLDSTMSCLRGPGTFHWL